MLRPAPGRPEQPSVKAAVLNAAVQLGDGAAPRSIVQRVAEQHGIETTPGSVRATLSRYGDELAQLRAQHAAQSSQGTGRYA
jgi:hypothetical protein